MSNEPGSTFACRLEDGGFAACASPKSYPSLPDGGHKFTVRTTDGAGNTSQDVVYVWTIDTVAPATTIGQKPSLLSNVSSPVFTFSAEAGSSFSCKLDTGAFAACTSPKPLSSLADGAHTFAVKATDAAGNTGADATFVWTIDTAAPTAAINQKPASPINDTTPTFAFTSETGALFTCTLDGVAAPCSSPKTYPPLADGSHTFAVKATDAAGNTGPQVTHTWTIDTQAPTAQITGKPADPSNVKSPTLSFVAGEPATFVCKLDDASFSTCSSPRLYTNLPDGSRTFSVRPTDTAGNTGAVVTYSWMIDTVAPAAQITGKPGDFSNDTTPTFVFAAGEVSTFQCKLDGLAFAACASPQNYSTLAQGSHTFRVKANDAAGNPGPETTYTWTIDTALPVATITAKPSDPSKSQSPSFSFISSEPGPFECRLDAEPFVTCASPKDYLGLSDGNHTFVVRAIDRAGNPSADKSHTWTLDATAPTTQIATKPVNPSNLSSPSFTFTGGPAVDLRVQAGRRARLRFLPVSQGVRRPRGRAPIPSRSGRSIPPATRVPPRATAGRSTPSPRSRSSPTSRPTRATAVRPASASPRRNRTGCSASWTPPSSRRARRLSRTATSWTGSMSSR